MDVTLTRATNVDRHIVEHMFVAFFYDLSEYDDNLIINAHGLPMWAPSGGEGPRTYDECVRFNWWIRNRCELWVIRVDQHPAGFTVILRNDSQLPEGVDIELMDFYIAPKYRRMGVGTQAARAAFNLYRGCWLVYQLERNLPARTFWHKVIGEYTSGHYEDLGGGTEQRFTRM